MSAKLRELIGARIGTFDGLAKAVEADERRRFASGWRIQSGNSFAYTKGLDGETCRAVLIEAFLERDAIRQAQPRTFGWTVSADILGALLTAYGRSALDWTIDEVHAVLDATGEVPFDAFATIDDYRFAAGLAEQLERRQGLDKQCRVALQRIRDNVGHRADSTDGGSASNISALSSRLLALLPQPHEVFGGVTISEADNFGQLAIKRLKVFAGHPELGSMLALLAKPGGSSSWRAEVVRQHTISPLLRNLARCLVDVLATMEISLAEPLAPSSVGLIKGSTAVLGEIGDALDAVLLERATNNSSPVARAFYAYGAPTRACIAALGALRLTEAQSALVRLQATYRSGDLKKRIAAALDDVASRSGMSLGELIERQVDDAALDGDHALTVGNSSLAAELRVTSHGVTTTWLVDGHPVAKVLPEAKTEHAEIVTAVKTQAKALATAVAAQRTRLEGLFAEGRTWNPSDWQSFYIGHRLVGPLAADLLWQGEIDGNWTTFLGSSRLPEGTSKIRLWHPLEAPAEEIEYWRNAVVRLQLRQPFKQVYREHYVLTPAERESGRLSARFARHTLRNDQVFALTKARGWQAKWLGAFDGGYEATPRFVLGEGQYRVGFDLTLSDDYGFDDCALSGVVHFERLSGKAWRLIDLTDVPPLVFSEAMRDVDLFVSIATVTNDPTWRERRIQAQAARDAWDVLANGQLTPAGEIRRAALERILPNLKIASQCTLDDRSLRVRGTYGEYAINLGTANVMLLPRNLYLCIIQGSSGASRGIFLPFEGDDLLSLVLSKAVLLAADHKITDESILRQLRWAAVAEPHETSQ